MLSPTRLAIVLLLQYPWLAQQNALPSEYAQSDMPGINLLYQLYTLLTQNPALSTGQVLEYWRDRNEGKQLAKLALFELIIPNAGIQDEFSGALQRIQALVHDKTIQQLLDKANQGQLTPAEKQRLMQLIAQR